MDDTNAPDVANPTPDDVPLAVSGDDPAWQMEGDDSVGDAEDPHRNDEGQFDEVPA